MSKKQRARKNRRDKVEEGGGKRRPLVQPDKKQIGEFESHKEGCEYVASTVREPERERSQKYTRVHYLQVGTSKW